MSIALSSFEQDVEFKCVHNKLLSIGKDSKACLIHIYKEDLYLSANTKKNYKVILWIALFVSISNS